MENPVINAVSVSGTIENSRSLGFNLSDCVSEKIDNSVKAGATQVDIYLDKDTLEVALADNGAGQTKTELANSYILNNRKKASKTGQGKFGQGGKMLEIELSDCKAPTTALSKKAGEKLHQAEANWPEAIACDRFDVLAHGAERDQEEFWIKYAVDKDQGTLYRIKCTEETFAHFNALVQDGLIIEKLALTYPDINEGKLKIVFKLGDAELIVPSVDLLNDGTESTMLQTIQMSVYYDADSNCLKVYYQKNDHFIRIDFSGKAPKLLKECPPNTFKKLGEMTLLTKVAFEWLVGNPIKGGIYFDRQNKIIDHYQPEYKKAGDFDLQRTKATCRSKLQFDSDLDEYMQIEVNKSHINARNVDPAILKTAEYLIETYCKEMYKTHPNVVKKKEEVAEKNKKKKEEKKKEKENADLMGQALLDIPVLAQIDAQLDAQHDIVVPVPMLKFKGNTLTKASLLEWVRANKDDVEALSKLEALLL
jgi:hypothetical protein